MEPTDRELLARFVRCGDEASFRVLVERYLPLVLGAARRVTANGELAQDVAQQVFMRLAGKAGKIPMGLDLGAWCHRVSRHLAIDLVRSESRRKHREAVAAQSEPLISHAMSDPDPDWSVLAPKIDQMIDRLSAADREVLLLRYFRNQAHALVARQLGISEEAAKKRAARALARLRKLFEAHGIRTSTAALAVLMPAHAAPPVSASLVSAVCAGIAPPLAISASVPIFRPLDLVMSTAQKSAIAAAALVFTGSFAYSVRPVPEAQHISGPTDSRAKFSVAGEREFVRHRGRPLPTSDAARLERLREILKIPLGARRARELADFIDQLALADFPNVAGDFQDLKAYPVDFDLLYGTWVRSDPIAAADWSHEHVEGGFAATVLQLWGGLDPAAAIDWVLRKFPDAPVQINESRSSPLVMVLSGIAMDDPAAALRELERIPNPRDRKRAILELAATLSSTIPDDAEHLLAVMPESAERSALIVWSLDGIVRKDSAERGFELLMADAGAQESISVSEYFKAWQLSDDAGALAKIQSLPPGRIQDQAVAGYCMAAVNANPAKTFAMLGEFPGAIDDRVIAKMAADTPLEEIQLAVEATARIHDPELRDEAMGERLRWWLERKPQQAQAWMSAHSVPSAVAEGLAADPPTILKFE